MGSFAKNFGLFLSGLIASFIVLSPSYQLPLMNFVDSDSRHILGTLMFNADNTQYKIVKLRQKHHILVEIYKVPSPEKYDLVSRFQIPDSRDVFYDFQKSLSNLFAANIDEDAIDEVVVPVLDDNMVAHLNVIKFDQATKSFLHYSF